MAGINAMIARVQRVNIPVAIEEAVTETSTDLVRLQRLQLLSGKTNENSIIGIYKSDSYAFKKFVMNPLPGFRKMDFRLTGDFYRGIFADARDKTVVIDSADEKTERLLEINPDIFGLNKKNSEEYARHYLGPVATRIIKKQIND